MAQFPDEANEMVELANLREKVNEEAYKEAQKSQNIIDKQK